MSFFWKCTERERVQGIAPPTVYSVVHRCKKWMQRYCWLNTQLKTTGIQRIMLLFSFFFCCFQWVDQQHRSFVRPLLCRWGVVKRKRLTKRPRTNRVQGKKEKPFQIPQLGCGQATKPSTAMRGQSTVSIDCLLSTTHDAIWKVVSDLVTGCSSHNRICCCGTKAHRIINRNEIYGPGVILGQQYVAVFAQHEAL